MRKLKNIAIAASGAVLMGFSMGTEAKAITFSGDLTQDAGQLLDSSQFVGIGTTQINGTLNAASNSLGDRADLFSFHWTEGAFSAQTFGNLDTQLFLFRVNTVSGDLLHGSGYKANDDIVGGSSLRSKIEVSNLAEGYYYLGISSYDYDPLNSFGEELFADQPFRSIQNVKQGLTNNDTYLANWGGRQVQFMETIKSS